MQTLQAAGRDIEVVAAPFLIDGERPVPADPPPALGADDAMLKEKAGA